MGRELLFINRNIFTIIYKKKVKNHGTFDLCQTTTVNYLHSNLAYSLCIRGYI